MADVKINGQTYENVSSVNLPLADESGFATFRTAEQEAAPKDVNFYDYDGKLLYSYTLEEAQALTELPPLPEHDGLICQGWNWTLEGVTDLDRPMDVGASYITDDGATRLKIRIVSAERMDLPLYFYQSVDSGVEIDWGDGTSETVSGTGYVNTTHTYTAVGDYTISLMPVGTCTVRVGGGSSTKCVFGDATSMRAYTGMLREVNIGKNTVWIPNYAFTNCHNLEVCTAPVGVDLIHTLVFYRCSSLRCFIFPYGSTGLGNDGFFREAYALSVVSLTETVTGMAGDGAFRNCRGLQVLTLPEGITAISTNFCNACYSLVSLVLPSTITDIYASALCDAYSLKLLDCTRCTAVPTLANTNAFTDCPSDMEIRVPAALYDEWIAATNWATYADYIVGV